MELTWLGTAGFIIKNKSDEIVFDPFLSRGPGSASPFTVKSFENSQALFVGHGHFDHTFDIPQIVSGTELKVFAPGLTGKILQFRGVPKERIIKSDKNEILFKPFKVRTFRSSHVNFDLSLIVSTLKRCSFKSCLNICGLGLKYPKGMVQSYVFEVNSKKVLFLSSAGSTEDELRQYQKLEVDYFLAPLQGHSLIQDIVAKHTVIINPKIVIPHHHDDFYPPLSQNISVDIFRDKLKSLNFKGDVLEIPLFQNGII